MIALLTTYFLVFYILIPGILFRFVTSFYVPLKLFERTRTQEATFAVAVAILPFLLALFSVWHLPISRHYPFPVYEGSAEDRQADYRRVTAFLASNDVSKYLSQISPDEAVTKAVTVPKSAAAPANEANWIALNAVLRRQARFLTWYFVAVALEACAFGFLASRYGSWQDDKAKGWRSIRNAVYKPLAGKMILPNISEWHLLLTDFNWPARREIFVSVDILQADGRLYQGNVADYFLDSAGKLTGILLQHVSRFDRETYASAKANLSNPGIQHPVSTSRFWINIPSRHFYVSEGTISNLNVRFVPRDETLISLAESILDKQDNAGFDITVGSTDDPEYPGHPASHQPDIYS
jgi:hypothetical protein